MTTPARHTQLPDVDTEADVIRVVAQAVGETLCASCVVLFGSRARGDYRPDSDVDLAAILATDTLDATERRDVREAALELAVSVSGGRFRYVDVIVWTEAEYRTKKRSINHVAGRAWREGRILYGAHATYPGEEVVSELDNARELLMQCRRQLRGMSAFIDPETDEENFGLHARRAVELALKAWVSLAGERYERTHKIADLIATLTNAGVAEAQSHAHFDRLSPYAVKYIYEDVPDPVMDREFVFGQVEGLVQLVETLLQQAEKESGAEL